MKYSCRDEKAEVRPKDPFYSRANHLQPWRPLAAVPIFFFYFLQPPAVSRYSLDVGGTVLSDTNPK
jgi:hypothetical protein